jgi:glutamate 5-kinase
MAGKKRWLAFFPTPEGKIVIDRGAVKALAEKNRSLLPAGIRSVEGEFGEGSVISIVSEESGEEIGRGLANYASSDISRIAGCQSRDIAGIIGICEYEEVVHRDNLVILKTGGKEKA